MRVIADAPRPGIPSNGLDLLVREAHYPARVRSLLDQDGNPLYLNF